MAMDLCKPNLLLKLFFIVSLLLLLAAATPTEEEEEKQGNWGPTEGEEHKRQLFSLQLGRFMSKALPASKGMEGADLIKARKTLANEITNAENTGTVKQKKWDEFKEGVAMGNDMIGILQNVADTYCKNHHSQCCGKKSTTTNTSCVQARTVCQITELVFGNDCKDIPLSSQPQIQAQAQNCEAWQQANDKINKKYHSCLSVIRSESTQANSPGPTQANSPGQTQANSPGQTQANSPGLTLTFVAAAAAYCLYHLAYS